MTGVSGVDDELERRGEYYHAEWLYDAVDRFQQEESATSYAALQASANVFTNAEGGDE